MNITGFTLVNNGFGGIIISGMEYFSSKNGKAIVDNIKGRHRKIPISKEMSNDIQKLRYAFLNLTGHWLSAYNQFFQEGEPMPLGEEAAPPHQFLVSLWKRTTIIEAKIDDEGFKLKGTIRITDEKSITITTPSILEEDDFIFFHDTMVLLDDLVGQITEYFSGGKNQLDEAKQYLLEMFKDNQKASDELEEKSEEELDEMYQEKLEQRGAIVIMPPTGVDKIGNDKPEILANKNVIPEKKEEVDKHEEVAEDEKVAESGKTLEDAENGEVPEDNEPLENDDFQEADNAKEAEQMPELEPKDSIDLDFVPADVDLQQDESQELPSSLEDLEYSSNLGGSALE